jgi:hypothetical protein
MAVQRTRSCTSLSWRGIRGRLRDGGAWLHLNGILEHFERLRGLVLTY